MSCVFTRSLRLAALTLLMAQTASALYIDDSHQKEPQYAPTRLIVKLNAAVDAAAVDKSDGVPQIGVAGFDNLNRRFQAVDQKLLFERVPGSQMDTHLKNVFILTVNEGTDILEMKSEYEQLASVEYASPDYEVELYDTPNDSLYPHQWALNNTGQGYYFVDRDINQVVIAYGTPDADIDAEEVFENPPDNTATVVVAIVDTGVDRDHPDLAGHMWTNPGEIPDNSIDDDHNGYVDDYRGWDFAGDSYFDGVPDNDPSDGHGHGTHCSGIITALTGNGAGVAGIAPNCRIMALKFYPVMLASWAAEGIVYAADNGADVLNMSWGLPYAVPLWKDAIDYARAKGVIMIAAAGNDGFERVNFPAGYSNNIAVAASTSDDEIAFFSTYGSNINVCAPGYGILSLRAAGTDMYNNGTHIIDDIYYLASGTSMACPHVVGIAAYLRSVSPGITHAKVQDILEQTADDYLDPFGTGENLPGWDKYSGYGRVNLNNALAAAPAVRARITAPTVNSLVSGVVEVSGIADGADFNDYQLEYGAGRSPTSWTQIASSPLPVTNGTLASWNTAGLTGIYTLRLKVGIYNVSMVTVAAANEAVAEISSPTDLETVINYVEIRGTAICPDFSKAALSYGAGSSPSSWTTIFETTVPQTPSSVMYSWTTGGLSAGTYTLKLSVYSSESFIAADSIQLNVESPFAGSHGWRVDLGSQGSIVPNYGDFDNDGQLEIVVGTESGIRFFNPDGSEKTTGVPVVPAYDFRVPVAVGNLDGDGIDDIVAVSASPSTLYGYPSSASSFEVPLDVGPEVDRYDNTLDYRNPQLFLKDIDNDGLDEINYSPGGFAGAGYYIFNPDGTQWGCTQPIGITQNVFLPADVDGDSVCEIYIFQDHLKQVDSCGQIVDSFPMADAFQFWPKGLSAVDIDYDGKVELLLLGDHVPISGDPDLFYIYAFDEGLTLKEGWPHNTGITGFYQPKMPIFGDLNGDNSLEYVVTFWDLYGSFVHVWSIDGRPFMGDSTQNGLFASPTGEVTLHMPLLADLTGDGNPEIIGAETPAIFAPDTQQTIDAWENDGLLLNGWPIVIDANVSNSDDRTNTPVFCDIDQDGLTDMIATNVNDELLLTEFEGATYSEDASPCPIWRYNRAMDNTYMPHVPEPMCGDANGSESVDIDDIVYLLSYIFSGGPAPYSEMGGDPDCSGATDIDDVVYLISFIFSEGPAPCDVNGDGTPDCWSDVI